MFMLMVSDIDEIQGQQVVDELTDAGTTAIFLRLMWVSQTSVSS